MKTIEEMLEEHEQEWLKRRGMKMPLHHRESLRLVIERHQDTRWGELSNRDYVYGQDEGEPPQGAHW